MCCEETRVSACLSASSRDARRNAQQCCVESHDRHRSEGEADLEAAWLARLDASIASGKGRKHGPAATGSPKAASVPQVLWISGTHPAALDEAALMKQSVLTKGRGRGPGGQNRNKVETLIEITHEATGICAHAGERRTAMENRRVAVMRLRVALALMVRAQVGVGDCRSELWKRRCVATGKNVGKIVVSPAHEDFPAMLAEALDVLWASELDVKHAAVRLLCTASQLIKLIKDQPHALAWVNAHRAARGLHELK